jgi:hypothetical protein
MVLDIDFSSVDANSTWQGVDITDPNFSDLELDHAVEPGKCRFSVK